MKLLCQRGSSPHGSRPQARIVSLQVVGSTLAFEAVAVLEEENRRQSAREDSAATRPRGRVAAA